MVDLEHYRCNTCDRAVTGEGIKHLRAGSGEMLACATCGEALVSERSRVVKPLASVLATAFVYPFRPLTLGVSLAISLFAGAAGFLPFGGLIGAGIRFGWLFAVLRAASAGNDDVEVDATDISASLFGWIGPAVRVFVAAFVAFLPALAASLLLGEAGALVASGLALVGALYLPAALIVASQDERWLAPANPGPPIALIARIPGSYFTACAMLVLLFAVAGGAVAVARGVDLPIVSSGIEWVLGYVPLVAAARMLGILIHEKREEL